MTYEELVKKVNYQPAEIEDLGDFDGHFKFIPFESSKHSFALGFERCKSNVLADKNNAVAIAMCKDSR